MSDKFSFDLTCQCKNVGVNFTCSEEFKDILITLFCEEDGNIDAVECSHTRGMLYAVKLLFPHLNDEVNKFARLFYDYVNIKGFVDA